MVILESALVVVLIAINGYLAMSELAVVSARRSRLQMMATGGDPRAETALKLAEDPGRFLSTVQVGITLVGVLAGAFSGATIAERFADWLETFGLATGVADAAALAIIVAAITYLSLIIGELVPKQFALRHAESIAVRIAPLMMRLARWASPLVWLLDTSSRLVLRVFGAAAPQERTVTEEEIRAIVAEAETAGVVEPAEKRMIASVMRLGDRTAKAVMTPRPDVDWIDLDDDEAAQQSKLKASGHSRIPVAHRTVDEIDGIIQAKDLLNAYLDGKAMKMEDAVREVPFINENVDVLEVIDVLRTSPVDMAIVVDEYGMFQGLITMADIIGAIAGEYSGVATAAGATNAVRRDDSSWLLDGAMPVDQASEILGTILPSDRDFHTLAGFMLWLFRRIPEVGDTIEWRGWHFEVVDLDGRRIDKVIASRHPKLRRLAL